MDPHARLLELGEQCRQMLHSTEFSIRREFPTIEFDIDRLRASHPNLTGKLESLYRDAYPSRAITTMGLIGFAIERKLLLTGDPYPQSAHSA
jgi:hypothetical protein